MAANVLYPNMGIMWEAASCCDGLGRLYIVNLYRKECGTFAYYLSLLSYNIIASYYGNTNHIYLQ